MTERPIVSVIIVNWNGAGHLRVCLPSLASQSFKSLEIIVVDNCSSDDSAQVASTLGARWLLLEKNLGLAPALNRGAAIAIGDLLLFVNNDMRFDPEFVAALVEPLERDADLFATDGMQYNWNGTVREHLATRLTAVRCRRDSCTELVPGLHFYQQEKIEKSPVFMASAACMMVRRTTFEKIGGFDNRLPLGYEDAEICWRAWVLGRKTVYVPHAVCWHRVGGSVKSIEAARFSFRGILKGRLLLATKLLPSRYVFRTWLVSIAGLAKDISWRRRNFAMDRVRVLFQMAGLSAQLLRERRTLFSNAKTSPEEQLDFMLRLSDDDGQAAHCRPE
jgi:N-acetylglucosaminyl-diphospho-decaprenol L-rhamnosyltransferase